MKTLGCIGIIVVALIVAVGIFALGLIGSYNGLVNADQSTNGAWSQVENVYQRRADLIPNLVETVKGAAGFEKDTFTQVAQARASVGKLKIDASQAPTTAEQLDQFQKAQGQLGAALSRLMVVVEKYPELKATERFADLQAQLEGTENRIAVERMKFTKVVQDYNTRVRSFPTVLYAGMMGFSPKPYFTADQGAAQPPKVSFTFTTDAK